MKYIKTFKLFESRMGIKDNSGKEYTIEFKSVDGESIDEMKERAMKELKFFWLHKDEFDGIKISFFDNNRNQHTSDKLSTKDRSLDEIKHEFFKSLKFMWLDHNKSNTTPGDTNGNLIPVEVPQWDTY